MGSGREAHGKENPRKLYAVGLRTEPAHLVRGSSRRITIMRFRPANIRVINRRNSRLDRDLRCLLRKDGKKKENKEEEKTKRYLTRSFHISASVDSLKNFFRMTKPTMIAAKAATTSRTDNNTETLR